MRKNRMTFEDWIQPSRPKPPAKIGLSYMDLSDCCYADWYENGAAPKSAANRALKNDGYKG